MEVFFFLWISGTSRVLTRLFAAVADVAEAVVWVLGYGYSCGWLWLLLRFWLRFCCNTQSLVTSHSHFTLLSRPIHFIPSHLSSLQEGKVCCSAMSSRFVGLPMPVPLSSLAP